MPVPGRPGYKPAPHTFTEQIVIFIVRTPRARLDELLALCAAAHTLTRTDDPTKEARVELGSAIPGGEAPFDDTFEVTVTLSIYEGVWRDVDLTVFGAASVVSPSQSFELMTGISAPVYDMDVFLRGVFGDMMLLDSGGSWLKTRKSWDLGTSSNGLLYVGATGQAFVANESAPWTPIADATQYVDVSGNGGFRLTPHLVFDDPANRRVDLTLTTLTQTSTTLRVRGKRSYRMN